MPTAEIGLALGCRTQPISYAFPSSFARNTDKGSWMSRYYNDRPEGPTLVPANIPLSSTGGTVFILTTAHEHCLPTLEATEAMFAQLGFQTHRLLGYPPDTKRPKAAGLRSTFSWTFAFLPKLLTILELLDPI